MNDMKKIAKAMALATVEKIAKHNMKAAQLFKSGNYNKNVDSKSFHKKLLNLCYIIYPEIDAVRDFIEKEHPEYAYIIDFVEKLVLEDKTASKVIAVVTEEGAA
jgi:hypothetical protein